MKRGVEENPLQLGTSLRAANRIAAVDPLDAFNDMGCVGPDEITNRFLDFMKQACDLSSDETLLAAGLLGAGLNATKNITVNTLQNLKDPVSLDKALRIAQNDMTVRTIGTVANTDPDGARALVELSNLTYSPYAVNLEEEAIVFIPGFHQSPSEWRGCPASSKYDKSFSPAFSNFVKWSGSLAVYSLFLGENVPQSNEATSLFA
jgi:hypothetical protein